MTTQRSEPQRRESLPDTACGAPAPDGIAELVEGPYRVRFARDAADLERAQRLRFEVFNVELGEGLASAWVSGRDEDRFDRACHHLLLEDAKGGSLVGTYRMQTAAMARVGEGFYTDQEYDLALLPDEILERSVELGRACILPEHRNGTALYCLWRGLAAYVAWTRKRTLFGCCSLTSQDPAEGAAVLARLEREGRIHPELRVLPREEFACRVDGPAPAVEPELPRLFSTYLRYGAMACSPPALDREFGTIDYLVVLDLAAVAPRLRAMFFAGLDDPLAGEGA